MTTAETKAKRYKKDIPEKRALLRTCIGCGIKKSMNEMKRVKLTELKFEPGVAQRGAWICSNSVDCANKALKKNAFSRTFKSKIIVSKDELYRLLNLE